MSRLIVILSIIALSAVVCLNKQPWECDNLGKQKCQQSQTCCRGGAGWRCYPVTHGTCCSDGKSACPHGTKCNIRQQRCDKNILSTFAFLEENDESYIELFTNTTVPAFVAGGAENAINLLKGLNDGLALFNNLTHRESCQNPDPQIVEDFRNIVEILKNITPQSNFTVVVDQIVANVRDLQKRITVKSEQCSKFNAEVTAIVDALKAHFQNEEYLGNLISHTVINKNKIAAKIQEIREAIPQGDFYVNGKLVGAFFRYVAFWNFKN